MRRALPILIAAGLLFSCRPSVPAGRTVIISVALDYSSPDDGASTLHNPPNDARAFMAETELLASASGERYDMIGFLSENGIWSVNGSRRAWGKPDVLSAIRTLGTGDDDLIIFYYSGHGSTDGSLVIDNGPDTKEHIAPDELIAALSSIRGKKCVILDSCHSGIFIQDTGIMADGERFDDGRLVSEGFASALRPSLRISLSSGVIGNEDIWILSAATADQLSYDSGSEGLPSQDRYGAFTYSLLISLGYDMEEDVPRLIRGREVTFLDLYDGIMDSMSEEMRRIQTPQITLSPLDLVLFSPTR